MKRTGDSNYYSDWRDEELMTAYKKVISSTGIMSNEQYFSRLVMMPTSRFFISSERAMLMVNNIRKNVLILDNIRCTLKKEMYKEIYARFLRKRNTDKVSSDSEILESVITHPAPRFYLTPRSAELIINRMKCIKKHYRNR